MPLYRLWILNACDVTAEEVSLHLFYTGDIVKDGRSVTELETTSNSVM